MISRYRIESDLITGVPVGTKFTIREVLAGDGDRFGPDLVVVRPDLVRRQPYDNLIL